MDNKEIKNKAKNLRKNMTPQETKIWQKIRNRQFYGYRFLRQYIIGSYIVDFLCREKNIIVEIDGGQHNETNNIVYDTNRDIYLKQKGYTVIRFWNNEIDNNIEGVWIKLKQIFEIKE